MGMYDNFLDILKYLKSDEELLRLLYYPPEDLGKDIPDPLDVKENILDMDISKRSKIINHRIKKSAKIADLDQEQICRLYVYAGDRRPERGNYLMANQELVIEIFCHSDFEEGDLRSTRIADRLNKLLCHERVTGIGKMDFVDGRPLRPLYEYVAYQVVFRFGSTKR